MGAPGELRRGREFLDTSGWADAYTCLAAADRESPLEVEDLERFAIAAHLIGREDDCEVIRTRAHHEWVRRGEWARAARCAFWLAFEYLLKGEPARCSGWLARGRRLVRDGAMDCVEQGYLLVPSALETMFGGNAAAAQADFVGAANIGERFGDADLMTLSGLCRGQALIRLGKAADGVAALDEVMVTVTSGEVSAILSGVVYCAVLLECRSIFDVRRAREWTVALSRWCERQPDLVPYRGQCLVHRSEIMQLQGEWPDALREAQEACERLSGGPAVGLAFYQLGELSRLRGDFDDADGAFRQASRSGPEPQPGLALLRLAQGQIEVAATAIRRVVDQTQDLIGRAHLLGAYVEIMLAADEVALARAAANELSEIAAELDAAFLHAVSAHAGGAVRLAEGDGRTALAELRRAWVTWQELDAPYGAARARVLMALACRQLGDEDSAMMELDAARSVFGQLGAEPDLAQVERLSQRATPRTASALTSRELEVLLLVAAGKTNRQIGAALLISDHTVRRHLQNIFVKLDVPSRAAAAAHALRHKLI